MVNFKLLLFALCCHLVANKVKAIENHVKPPPLQDVYEFWLSVDYRLTMAVWDNDQAPPIYLNFTGDQKYYYRQNTPAYGCTNYQEFKGDLSKLIIGNGLHRDVIAVNDSIPAPSLIVYSGSTVVVHVTNNMDDPVSIHWHGLDQRGSFFMDGVTPLTQCPIVTGQTFTYKFKIPDPPGTYWYHGHSARDRSDGLFGALIVLDPYDREPRQDLIAMIGDWYKDQADSYYKHVRNDNNMFAADYEDKEKCYLLDRDIVGSRLGVVQWESAVVNGRGWHNLTELKTYADRLPLEEFRVESQSEKPIRIRLINAGMIYGLLFSVDQHKMTVVASDAANILPVENVDYVHVNPGERYDVILKANPGVESFNKRFLVRIRSMEKLNFMLEAQRDLEQDHFGLAWLVYDEAPKVGYTDEIRDCTEKDQCLVVNCPFEQYPREYNRICINLEKLRSTKKGLSDDEVLRPVANRFEQHFLNFGFQDHVHAINGRQFRPPSFPPFMHPGRESEIMQECAYECGRERKCSCTHHINLTLGNVVELVLYNRGPDGSADARRGFSHPVHLHGHHFYVLKTGWPTYDNQGLADQCTEDITCDNFYCDFTSWNGTLANRTVTSDGQLVPWQYDNDDGYKPLLKDTVYVPFGGYVVVRFKADNPGWWFSHCHILIHASDGMAMFFREGTPDQMPHAPDDYPLCGVTSGQMRRKQEAAMQTKAISSNDGNKLNSGLLQRRIAKRSVK